ETTNDVCGARHMIDGVFYLGAKEDGEADGRPTDLADGDDGEAFQSGDDEDGVWFPTTFNAGRKATVVISNSLPGTLFAWVDYDLSGSWREETDNVFPEGTQLLSAYNWVVIDVPEIAAASPGSYARFRFVESGKVAQSGTAENGEVEDYRVPVLDSFRAWVIVDKLLYSPGDPVAVGFYVNETAQVTLICHRPDGTQRFLLTTTAEAGRHTLPERGDVVTAELPTGTTTIEMIATSLLSGATAWLTTPYVVSP
ncbi:MAG: GEVED domain-containing protein, partial [Thermotogota bacterium]